MIPLPRLSIIPLAWVHFPGITLSTKKQLCALTNIRTHGSEEYPRRQTLSGDNNKCNVCL